ncbi:hypothetical protein [Geminicoccus flavidas]|uniref:hypothetical protein n=1 Tax=Geminicoccus flavidas TaxID=2506407 RepID=UPI00135A92A6|nr:hypothetical protein [Geminicoccus flavidas]
MTTQHQFIEVLSGISICRCFVCEIDRLQAVARIADAHPEQAARAARAFADFLARAAIVAGDVAELPDQEQ